MAICFLYRDYITGPIQVLIQDPPPFGLHEILTGAHMRVVGLGSMQGMIQGTLRGARESGIRCGVHAS